jgi:tetratricopeptide (TPR) repeat protein
VDQTKLKSLIDAGDFKAALLILNGELDANLKKDELYHQRGLVYAGMYELENALSDYNRALEINPNHANILSDRGVLHFKMKNNTLALKDFDSTVLLEPTNPYRYSSRAFIKSSMDELQGAIDDYEMAINLDPEDLVAHNNLGLVYEKLGYNKKAKKSFEKADQKKPTISEDLAAFPTINKKYSYIPIQTNSTPIAAETAKTFNYVQTLKSILTTKKGFSDFISFLKRKL